MSRQIWARQKNCSSATKNRLACGGPKSVKILPLPWKDNPYFVSTVFPFFSGYGTIVINYSFQSGIQGREHPNPGQSYSGTSRVAYLPNTPEGCDVLQLLRRAFNSRLVFTVGTSATTGLHNQITWNDIHHKTTTHGGPYGYGILMYVCMYAC